MKTTSLATEYRQWEFSFDLSRDFLEWIGCHQETSNLTLKEAVNILQRWLLAIHQEKTKRDDLAPLFPVLGIEHPINQKLATDIVDKRFFRKSEDAWEVVRKTLTKIETFRSECHINPHPDPPLLEKYELEDSRKTKLIIGKFETPFSPRLHFLVNNFGLEETATMILRYEAVGSGSYQWGDPVSVHKLYYVEFGARYEGFSSPLNSRFLGQVDTKFCSLFPDTDGVFGSLGNFMDIDLRDFEGGWTVNPPFIETVLESAAKKIISTLESGINCYFFMNFPKWTDANGWNLLNESSFKVARYDFNAGEFLIQDAYGASLRPRMKLSIFIMGIMPEGCPPVERVRDTVFREQPPGYNTSKS